MATAKLYRSILYMPGSNERALEKAKGLECDGVIFDLEDAVTPDKKSHARKLVRDFVSSNKDAYGTKKIFIRVNAWDTSWGKDDFCFASQAEPDVILLPKIRVAATNKRHDIIYQNPKFG